MTHNYLRKFILTNNLSQPEVADYLGVGKVFISQVERGVSKLLGHTNIATTQIYAKIVDEKKSHRVSRQGGYDPKNYHRNYGAILSILCSRNNFREQSVPLRFTSCLQLFLLVSQILKFGTEIGLLGIYRHLHSSLLRYDILNKLFIMTKPYIRVDNHVEHIGCLLGIVVHDRCKDFLDSSCDDILLTRLAAASLPS